MPTPEQAGFPLCTRAPGIQFKEASPTVPVHIPSTFLSISLYEQIHLSAEDVNIERTSLTCDKMISDDLQGKSEDEQRTAVWRDTLGVRVEILE